MRVEKQLWFWLAALVIVVLAIATLKDILLPFVAGIVGAYFLNPLADRLQAYGMKRTWAAILIVGVAAVLLALALVLLVPILVEQVRQLVTALPAETERFKAFIERWGREWLGPTFPSFQTALDKALAEQSQNWTTTAAAIMASVWSRGLALVNFVSLLLITPIVVFYLLVDWHPMLERIDQALPRDHASTIRRLAGDINAAVAAFIRGQGAICLVLGIYYAIGLSWAGIEYGLLVGLSTGLLTFIPIVGWLVGIRHGGHARHRAILAGPDAAPEGIGRADQRHGHRHGVSVAAVRRPEGRPAPGVADLRAVRLQLPVRAGGHADRRAAGGGNRGARALCRAGLPRQLRLQGRRRRLPDTPKDTA